MSFLLTGNILTGSSFRPDIITFVHREEGKTKCHSDIPSKLNGAGYLPIVSTVTGLGRSLLGLAHTIAHLVIAIFTRKGHHLREAGLGAQNFGRGLVEMVPFLGNAAMLFNDVRRVMKYEKIARDHAMAPDKAKSWGEEVKGHVAMFACGKFIVDRSFKAVTGKAQTLGSLEQAMYGHDEGRVEGYPYLLPEYQPWATKTVMFR
jgi:hypothetical protein